MFHLRPGRSNFGLVASNALHYFFKSAAYLRRRVAGLVSNRDFQISKLFVDVDEPETNLSTECIYKRTHGKPSLAYIRSRQHCSDIVAIEYILGDLDPADGETPEAAKARYLRPHPPDHQHQPAARPDRRPHRRQWALLGLTLSRITLLRSGPGLVSRAPSVRRCAGIRPALTGTGWKKPSNLVQGWGAVQQKCRNRIRWCQNRGLTRPPGPARGMS